MAISFADEYEIDKNKLDELDVFNSILDVDTRIYVDPAKLRNSDVEEFKNAAEKVENYFKKIVILLQTSRVEGDIYWRTAEELFNFKERSGTCLGYSKSGTHGNGIGRGLGGSTLKIMKDLIEKGRNEPILFEIINVFQEGIGCDRISDLLINILYEDILKFTNRVCRSLGIDDFNVDFEGKNYRSCLNKHNNQPLLLIPADVVTPLPEIDSPDDIVSLLNENQLVRNEIQSYIPLGGSLNKKDVLRAVFESDAVYKGVVAGLKSICSKNYDFANDPSGEHIWYENSKIIARDNPLFLDKREDVWAIVNEEVDYIKRIVEENGINRMLYREDGQPHKEAYAQMLFSALMRKQCENNNIDLSPETNSGRGPVDFKLSRGTEKVLVEVKLTTNTQLIHGLETQLPIYMTQESSQRGIFLVFDVAKTDHARKKVMKIYSKLPQEVKNRIRLVIVDATLKLSASKA